MYIEKIFFYEIAIAQITPVPRVSKPNRQNSLNDSRKVIEILQTVSNVLIKTSKTENGETLRQYFVLFFLPQYVYISFTTRLLFWHVKGFPTNVSIKKHLVNGRREKQQQILFVSSCNLVLPCLYSSETGTKKSISKSWRIAIKWIVPRVKW